MADIQTTYKYRVYSSDEYLGLLENVVSEFNYSQPINTVAAQLSIRVGVSFTEVAAEVVKDNLVDESGNQIVDENGNEIVLFVDYEFSGVPLGLGNRVIVTEFSSDYPNGVTVFDGFIYDWSANYSDNVIDITVMSHGVRMDHYLVSPESLAVVTQSTYDTTITLTQTSNLTGGTQSVLQTFQVPTSGLLSEVSVWYTSSSATQGVRMTLQLWEGTPSAPAQLLGVVTANFDAATTAKEAVFRLASAATVATSTTYYFSVSSSGAASLGYSAPVIQYRNSSVYANGQMYTLASGLSVPVYNALTADLAFSISLSDGSYAPEFFAYDPSNIVRTALDLFNDQGGLVTYSSTSVDDTTLAVDYTFRLATVLETTKKGYELSPSTWWYYVDVADNLFHLHDTSGSNDHLFYLGQQLTDLKISQSLSTLKNIVYFSGGDTGSGSNLFRVNKDQSSINSYGQWLDRVSDNRITVSDTADLYSLARIGKFSKPVFNVECTVLRNRYDITTIEVGQTVAFVGFDNFIDDLLLQIVEKRRYPDRVELKLGIPQARIGRAINDLERRLNQLETVNNPDTTT